MPDPIRTFRHFRDVPTEPLALAELLARRDRLPRHGAAEAAPRGARQAAGPARSAGQAADRSLRLSQPRAQPCRRRGQAARSTWTARRLISPCRTMTRLPSNLRRARSGSSASASIRARASCMSISGPRGSGASGSRSGRRALRGRGPACARSAGREPDPARHRRGRGGHGRRRRGRGRAGGPGRGAVRHPAAGALSRHLALAVHRPGAGGSPWPSGRGSTTGSRGRR
jgi:hypothetical protein